MKTEFKNINQLEKESEEILEILNCILDVKHLDKEQEEKVSELIDYHIESVEEYNNKQDIHILEEALERLNREKLNKLEVLQQVCEEIKKIDLTSRGKPAEMYNEKRYSAKEWNFAMKGILKELLKKFQGEDKEKEELMKKKKSGKWGRGYARRTK